MILAMERKDALGKYVVQVHHEHQDDSYWAEVPELPGCFASGDTLDELAESLNEAIALYTDTDTPPSSGRLYEVDEMKLGQVPT